ncbi:hypothetical protein BRC89_12095 [Halobacteriales archaeon QS_4_70_19]|nr:MAG: hypothetical protein BRC89_12095 [Halobacteriales archaeon QS_4_70_19]
MASEGSLVTRLLLAGPRRLALWVGANPLRASGALAALTAGWIILASLSPGLGVSPDLAGVTLDRLRQFTRAHPAYPAAVVVGTGALLLMR